MKPAMARKTEAIAVRVDPDLKQRARSAAEADRRTLSQWVEMLIQDALMEGASHEPRDRPAHPAQERR